MKGLGRIIYRVTTFAAAAILAVVIASLIYTAYHGDPYIQVGGLVLGVGIWLFGWAFRTLLSAI